MHFSSTRAAQIYWGLQAYVDRPLSRKSNIYVLRHSYSNRLDGQIQGSQLDMREWERMAEPGFDLIRSVQQEATFS